MTRAWPVILLIVLTGTAWGEADARRDQVAAATANAVGALHEEVARASVGRNLTVQELLERLEAGNDELLATLRRAEQIGGPRWIDEQTCQVQLEISGPRVARVLSRLAASNPKKSPIPPEVLELNLQEWQERTFSATGSSTSSSASEGALPPADAGSWARVDNAARRSAICAAKQDAAARLIDSVRPIALHGQSTVGDMLDIPSVGEPVRQWFANRPVTSIEFEEDLEVALTLGVTGEEFADALRDVMEKHQQLPVPAAEVDWERVRQELAQRMAEPVGRGRASGESSTTVQTIAVVPSQPPAWIDDQIDADGTAAYAGSKLKTARAAEADAAGKLQAQVNALPLNKAMSVGKAARQDPRVHEALERALSRAKISKADYHPDGRVSVKMTLDLRDVWGELRDNAE